MIANSRIVRVLATMAVGICHLTSASSGGATAKEQAPGYYHIRIGEFQVTALSDGTDMLPTNILVNTSAAEVSSILARDFLADPVETSINAFLVNTGSRLILVDTGAGVLMGPGLGKVLSVLKSAGYQPEQIDEVYLTHMHPDHFGGLLAAGHPAFPNAIIRAAKSEADYWLSDANRDAAPMDAKPRFEQAMSSLAPYISAGKFITFGNNTELVPGIRAVLTPGHSPGHTGYVIGSGAAMLVIWGDLVHVAAVQFTRPSIALKFDSDIKAAAIQRRQALKAAAEGKYWVAGAHLPFPGIGHVRSEGKNFVWVAANYGVLH